MTISMFFVSNTRYLRYYALPLLLCSGLTVAAQTAGATAYFPLGSNSQAMGITPGPDGALWFTDYGLNRIGRIATNGVLAWYSIPTPNSEPMGITLGADGALWFTEWSGNNIGRITTNGTITEFPIPTAVSEPDAITLGPDGALWFTEYYAGKVGRITTSGTITEYTNGSMLYLNGIVAGPDGALWVTEYVGTIYRVTTSGQITYFNVAVAGFGHPAGLLSGITVGPDRALWFTEADYPQGIQHVGRITTSGNVIYYAVNARGFPFHWQHNIRHRRFLMVRGRNIPRSNHHGRRGYVIPGER